MSTSPLPESLPARRWPRMAGAAVLLVAALLLDFDTVRRARRIEPLPRAAAAAPKPVDDARRRRDVLGTFATGRDPGDRLITIEASGQIRFAVRGSAALLAGDEDVWTLARQGDDNCLTTVRSGTLVFDGLDSVRYWGDAYRRQ